MKRLNEQIAIITGGVQGIGKATAERFAQEGATIVLWDVNATKGEKFLYELRQQGFIAEFQKVNVSDFNEVETAVNKTIEKFGRIDILINNAGITRDATLQKMTEEQWLQVINVNLTGVFNCSKSVSKFMIENKKGCIINASSVVGLYGNFGQTNYVATKSGIIGMTKVWARELGRKGIRVNAVAPGFILTDMVKAMPEKVIKIMQEKTPLGKLGTPEDIANTYLFLASDEAGFINGTIVSVDGGMIP